jgi:hypothetical protein
MIGSGARKDVLGDITGTWNKDENCAFPDEKSTEDDEEGESEIGDKVHGVDKGSAPARISMSFVSACRLLRVRGVNMVTPDMVSSGMASEEGSFSLLIRGPNPLIVCDDIGGDDGDS